MGLDLGGLEAIILDFGGVFTRPGPRNTVLSRCEGELGLQPGTLLQLLFAGQHWWSWSTGRCSAEEYWEPILAALGGHVPPALEPFRVNPFAYEKLNLSVVKQVRELQKRYRIALLSNATPYLEIALSDHQLTNLFDVIVNSSRVGTRKPEPAIFHLTLDRLRLGPQLCLFIDDKPRNTAVARQIGMAAVEFSSAAHLKRQLTSLGGQLSQTVATEPQE